jgi:hypothetical protein
MKILAAYQLAGIAASNAPPKQSHGGGEEAGAHRHAAPDEQGNGDETGANDKNASDEAADDDEGNEDDDDDDSDGDSESDGDSNDSGDTSDSEDEAGDGGNQRRKRKVQAASSAPGKTSSDEGEIAFNELAAAKRARTKAVPVGAVASIIGPPRKPPKADRLFRKTKSRSISPFVKGRNAPRNCWTDEQVRFVIATHFIHSCI